LTRPRWPLIESTFSTVRLRTRVTKGPHSRSAGLAMAYTLLRSAEDRWRSVNGCHLVALVRADATFRAGVVVESHPETEGPPPDRRAGPIRNFLGFLRLGITGTLARSHTTTNAIESMISIARTTARNVKRWRDGEMKKRWVAAGVLEAERSFRRVKGHQDLPKLLVSLRARRVGADPAKECAQVTALAPGIAALLQDRSGQSH